MRVQNRMKWSFYVALEALDRVVTLCVLLQVSSVEEHLGTIRALRSFHCKNMEKEEVGLMVARLLLL